MTLWTKLRIMLRVVRSGWRTIADIERQLRAQSFRGTGCTDVRVLLAFNGTRAPFCHHCSAQNPVHHEES